MEYTVNKLAILSGVSARTLHYYDQIGLLTPARDSSNKYRVYNENEVDKLRQILFYRELDVSLDEIKALLTSPDYDMKTTLQSHLAKLKQKRNRIDLLINNVTKSIDSMKGAVTMSDKEKFEGFKQKLIDENEQNYGSEIRKKYGDITVDKSNAKLKGLTQAQYDESEQLRLVFEEMLIAAFETGDPASEPAQKACELHKQWLCIFHPSYSNEYHMGLGEMYVADERFRANYDKLTPSSGCTEFLRDAINIYCKG